MAHGFKSTADMTVKSPATAHQMLCPLGKTFAETRKSCVGPDCALWRWLPLRISDPRFLKAVRGERDRLQAEDPKMSDTRAHKIAEDAVLSRPWDFDCPDRPEVGMCGLGGPVT